MSSQFNKIKYTTQRLVIRPYRASDYAAWAEALSKCHPKQNKFDPGRPSHQSLSLAAFDKKLKRYQAQAHRDEHYMFGIFHKKTGEHLGCVDLYVIVRKVLHWANLGFEIHNTHWGHGYAKEAARAALRIGFKELNLHRIEAAMELDHRASQSVARRIGMKKEGIRRKFFPTESGWEDLVVFALVR